MDHTYRQLILLVTILFLYTIIACNMRVNGNSDDHIPCNSLTIPQGMRCIPGGKFVRGSNRTTIDEDSGRKVKDEFPESVIEVSTFFMDTYEVTFSQYQECVHAGGCKPARPNYRGYSKPNQPMLGVNWYHANAYCTWAGKRLPTEAEWEKAARGDAGDLFPWGNEPADCTKAIIQEKGKKGCGSGTTWDVGSRPAYRYGLYDMAGNSWEWVNDWYSESYEKCGSNCMGKNPKGPCAGEANCVGHSKKVVRGGSWWWDGIYALAFNRRPHYPSNKPFHHFGFRCAKDAKRD